MLAAKAIATGIVVRCLLFAFMGEGGMLRLSEISSEYTSFQHGPQTSCWIILSQSFTWSYESYCNLYFLLFLFLFIGSCFVLWHSQRGFIFLGKYEIIAVCGECLSSATFSSKYISSRAVSCNHTEEFSVALISSDVHLRHTNDLAGCPSVSESFEKQK